jgi:hypothetical protein
MNGRKMFAERDQRNLGKNHADWRVRQMQKYQDFVQDPVRAQEDRLGERLDDYAGGQQQKERRKEEAAKRAS